MSWTAIGFGKYPDKTLPQVLLSDPDYFFWGMDSGAFQSRPYLRSEAEMLNRRARSIRIPNNINNDLEIEYIFHPPTMSLCGFDIVPASQPIHRGGSPAYRGPVLDFKGPSQHKTYDKLGYRLFIGRFKALILGNPNTRLTKKVAEDFFSNRNNFQNP